MPLPTLATLSVRKIQKRPTAEHQRLVYSAEKIRAMEHRYRQLSEELNMAESNPPKNPNASQELKYITRLQHLRHLLMFNSEKIKDLKHRQRRLVTNK